TDTKVLPEGGTARQCSTSAAEGLLRHFGFLSLSIYRKIECEERAMQQRSKDIDIRNPILRETRDCDIFAALLVKVLDSFRKWCSRISNGAAKLLRQWPILGNVRCGLHGGLTPSVHGLWSFAWRRFRKQQRQFVRRKEF